MKFVIGSLSLLAVLIVGAVIGPQFIDWQKYKPLITTEVQKATGLNVTIGGDISMSVFPLPHVKVEQLTVEAPLKKKFDNLVTVETAEVSVELMPLLEKKVNVKSVSLIKPDITIEILEDGTPSWNTPQLSGANKQSKSSSSEPASQAAASPKTQQDIALNAVTIEDGELQFINHQTGAAYNIAEANLDLKADSLSGPFKVTGEATYNEARINLDINTGSINNKKAVPLKAQINVANTELLFDGAAAMDTDWGAQGTVKLNSKNLYDAGKVLGIAVPASLNKPINISTILTADKKALKLDNLNFKFDQLQAAGKLSVTNFDEKNPLIIEGTLKSSSVIDTSLFAAKQKTTANKTNSDALKNAGKNTSSGSLVPQTLSVPFPLTVDLDMDVAGIKHEKAVFKNVTLAMDKKANAINAAFRINEMPGQGRTNGVINIKYASQSGVNPVIYADPTVTYDVTGNVGKLAGFLNDLAPSADTKNLTNLYSSAAIDIDGNVTGNTVKINKGVIKLDETVIGLGGSYASAINGGKPKANIDLQVGEIDLDRLMGKKKSLSNAAGDESAAPSKSASKTDPRDALKDVSIPVDLTFDISAQKAIFDGKTLNGVRLVGSMIGNSLSLSNASVTDYAGASLSAKGKVADIKTLSGIDAVLGLKTSDLGQFAKANNIDLSNLPAGINALDLNVEGKGNIETLNFAANVKALGGQFDASGLAKDLLGTPSYNDLAVRVKHPNGVKAIQVFSPEFKGVEGLAQAIDVYAKINTKGKQYNLSDIQAAIGQTNIAGNLDIDASGKIMAIKGDIKGKTIQLDSLLGAEKRSGGSSSSSGAGSSSSSTSLEGKWTDTPIDLDWINIMNVDVGLSADRLVYGKWDFANPSTRIKIANGQLDVDSLKAGVFGGTANLTSKVTADPVTLSVSTKMNNINLESLAGALSGSNRLKAAGNVSFETSVNGTGKSSRALVNSLNGSANLDGNNVVIKGFDLAKLAQGLSVEQKLATSLQNFAAGALKSGETRFDTITGDYKIEKGIVRIAKMQMDGPAAVIDSTGQADLPKWFINVDNKITLKNVPDMEPLNIAINGSLDNPKTLGTNVVEKYIQDKLKRKLGKELPGLLGDDVTNKLQQFGILPQKQTAPTPAPTPANDNAAPQEEGAVVEPQPVAPQEQTQEPQQQKIEKPEDAVNQILNSDNPEDAVNNLIKGLF